MTASPAIFSVRQPEDAMSETEWRIAAAEQARQSAEFERMISPEQKPPTQKP